MTTRAEAKAATRGRLLEAARGSLREDGAAALSLRAVAGRAGVVPSAVYRHFGSRDELLTQLLLDGYTSLAGAVEEAADTGGGWAEVTAALRGWALGHRHEFQLLYGTPVPGYAAPEGTIAAAARVAAVFADLAPPDGGGIASRADEAAARDEVDGLDADASAPALRRQLAGTAAEFGVSSPALAWTLASLSQLVGLLLLELGGHFVGTAEPADHLWRTVVRTQSGESASASAGSESSNTSRLPE